MSSLTASCVACGAFTTSARDTASGLMCRACARFMRTPLRELGTAPEPSPFDALLRAATEEALS